jgi:hypothetical protein
MSGGCLFSLCSLWVRVCGVFSPLRLDGLDWSGFLHSVGVVID